MNRLSCLCFVMDFVLTFTRGGAGERIGMERGEEGRESQGETLPQGAFLFVNYSSYPGRL